jgi:hypothetical protein
MSRRRRVSRGSNRPLSAAEDAVVTAGVVARLAQAVAKLRSYGSHADFTQETLLWEDDEDEGGLAASGVRKRPPDQSGSGSAALPEPQGGPVADARDCGAPEAT